MGQGAIRLRDPRVFFALRAVRVLPRTIIAGQLVIVIGVHAGELIPEWHGVFAS